LAEDKGEREKPPTGGLIRTNYRIHLLGDPRFLQGPLARGSRDRRGSTSASPSRTTSRWASLRKHRQKQKGGLTLPDNLSTCQVALSSSI
jgi:hypothetical protein